MVTKNSRSTIDVQKKIEVVKNVIVKHLKQGHHFDDIPKEDVSEIISPTSSATVSNQIRNCYQSVIQLFRDETSPFFVKADETNPGSAKIADYLDNLRQKIRKPRGVKATNKEDAKNLVNSFLDFVESEE